MTSSFLRPLYLGGLLLVCLVLGGGTQKGLTTVFALELLILPLVLDLTMRQSPVRSFGRPVYASLFLVALCFGLQFIPTLSPGLGFASSDPGRTLDSLAFTAFAVALFLSFGRLDPAERSRIVAWLLLGVILNIALALTQFAASRRLTTDLFPYDLSAGFFANANHFSSLLYVAIPFIIYQFDTVGRLPWASVALALIVFVEFAAGSTAGIFLSLGCALVSVAVVARVRPAIRVALLLLAALGATGLALNPGNVLHISQDDPLDRPQIAATTLAAIQTYLPLGSGYGTFDIAYPSAEQDNAVSGTYVNHAHNDPLELILEGGLPAAGAMLVYFCLLLWRLPVARRSQLSMAALCGIGSLLAHSLVDYPLRTAALVAVFALLNAIYFAYQTEAPSVRRHDSGGGVHVTTHR